MRAMSHAAAADIDSLLARAAHAHIPLFLLDSTSPPTPLLLLQCLLTRPSSRAGTGISSDIYRGGCASLTELLKTEILITYFLPLGRTSNTTLRILSVRGVPPPLWTKFSPKKRLRIWGVPPLPPLRTFPRKMFFKKC